MHSPEVKKMLFTGPLHTCVKLPVKVPVSQTEICGFNLKQFFVAFLIPVPLRVSIFSKQILGSWQRLPILLETGRLLETKPQLPPPSSPKGPLHLLGFTVEKQATLFLWFHFCVI